MGKDSRTSHSSGTWIGRSRYIEDIPRNSVYAYAADGLIALYFASALTVRRLFPESRWSLEYAKQFYRFVQWLLAVIIAILSPFVLTFAPFLTLADAVTKVATAVVIVLWLTIIGLWFSLSDEYKVREDDMVAKFEKTMTTPNYDAIITSEEFARDRDRTLPRLSATVPRRRQQKFGLLPTIKWFSATIRKLGWILALVNIGAIGYGITNVYYDSDMSSASIYCVSANNPAFGPGVDWGRIDITIGLNRTQTFLVSFTESIYTTWRITLLVTFSDDTWMYLNATTLPVNLGAATKFNMTLDSTIFIAYRNVTVDSISVTNTYSSGNPLFPLEEVHVNSKQVNLDLPYNATTIVPRMLKLRQLLIQTILLLSGLPVKTVPYSCYEFY